MARDLTPIVKRSRREKTPLHPKAVKGLTLRNYGPGQHGQSSMRQKLSQYAVQLREKQKVKRMYGLLEKQFRRVVAESERRAGVTGDTLLELLESRLDNVVYRLNWTTSRQAARQIVTHGHILLNGRRVDIPSILVKPGDVLEVRPKSAKNAYFEVLKQELGNNQPTIGWLSSDAKKLTAKVTGSPVRADIAEEINEQLIIEFYSR
ncbi:MAG TPA: 30S ribosomal protein S4 [Candidatus Polarisedimenticolaceae bacterium]|nr:30S ribosomal protein S4 [Candidatus Polarisedimenticolaceae bacterium]